MPGEEQHDMDAEFIFWLTIWTNFKTFAIFTTIINFSMLVICLWAFTRNIFCFVKLISPNSLEYNLKIYLYNTSSTFAFARICDISDSWMFQQFRYGRCYCAKVGALLSRDIMVQNDARLSTLVWNCRLPQFDKIVTPGRKVGLYIAANWEKAAPAGEEKWDRDYHIPRNGHYCKKIGIIYWAPISGKSHPCRWRKVRLHIGWVFYCLLGCLVLQIEKLLFLQKKSGTADSNKQRNGHPCRKKWGSILLQIEKKSPCRTRKVRLHIAKNWEYLAPTKEKCDCRLACSKWPPLQEKWPLYGAI